MTENDREKFAEAFFGLEEYFGKNHSKTIIEIYFKSLQDLSIDQFQMVCLKAIQKGRFFPKITELRDFAGVDQDAIEKDKPLLAWLAFRESIKTFGPAFHNNGKLSDPVIYRVVRMLGGMERIRMWTENEMPFRQKDFIEYYELAERHDAVDLLSSTSSEESASKNLLPSSSTENIETKLHGMTGNQFSSVFRRMEIKTFKPPDTPVIQIKKLIRHLINVGEDVSSFKKAHPEIYDDVINENREGHGTPGA